MTTEHASEHSVVAAPLAACWGVAIDMAHYPAWAQDIKEAHVLSRTADGLPEKVAFRAAAMGRTTSYTLNYRYPEAGDDGVRSIEWSLAEGDIMRRLDGSYRFAPTAEGGTAIDYELTVELLVPVPGFVKRRAEGKIVITALRELRHRVESLAASSSD